PEDLLQTLTLFLVFNFARDAALIGVGQEDQVPAWQRKVSRDAWTFGANRAFGHLDDDVGSRRIKAGNIALSDAGLVPFSRPFAFDHFHAAVKIGGNDIPVMEEGIFF